MKHMTTVSPELDDEIAEFEAKFDDILPGSVAFEEVKDTEVVNLATALPPSFFKEDLVGQILSLDDIDAKWVLQKIARQRWHLFQEILAEELPADSFNSEVQEVPLDDLKSKMQSVLHSASMDGRLEAEVSQLSNCKSCHDRQPVANGDAANGFAKVQPVISSLQSSVSAAKPRASTLQPSEFTTQPPMMGKQMSVGRQLLRRSVSSSPLDEIGDMRETDAHIAKQGLPMVQFSAFMYFCNETEENMKLDVMRIGDQSGRSEVHFNTRDATALAGHRYVATSGSVIFEPGEVEKDLSIPILFTNTWDTTTEFAVDLVKDGDNAPFGCTLGRYLWTTRVKVIDCGTFPSKKFKDQILNLEVSKINKWRLLYEYFTLNYAQPVVKKGTRRTVLLGFCHNVYLLLKLFMNVYLVDEVLANGSKLIGGSQEACLVLLGVLLVLPFAGLHIGDYKMPAWKVGGASRALLQKALMRKFFNYCESSRADLKQGDLTMAMARDTVKLVQEGYLNWLDMIRSTGELFMIAFFLLLAPVTLGTKPRVSGFVIICVFPLVLITFLQLRQAVTTNYVHAMDRAQDALVGQVDRNVTNYRMIADYNRRPFFVARYETRIKDFNLAAIFEAQILRNNLYCPQWLTVICVAFYTVVGGLQVIDGSVPPEERLTLGMFLANLNVIAVTGTAWGDIYRVLLDMQRVFPALETIVTLLNMPIDIPQRMGLNRHRRQKTRELRAELRKHCPGLPLDYLPITLEDVTFSYTSAAAKKSTGINSSGKMSIQQGTLVSLVGPRGEGKSTILKIIGGVILPEPGSFFIPSHLRVLHMSSEPLFYLGSLYDNLTFGTSAGDPDSDITRVREICRRLDLPQRLHRWIEEGTEGEVLVWGEVLSYTQRCLLCVARAMVTNPEILCIHKPTMSYDEKTSVRVLTLLKEFVKHKGVMQDTKKRHLRRPRTCIFTSSKIQGVDMSDEVYLISKGEGICRVDKEMVSLDMLG